MSGEVPSSTPAKNSEYWVRHFDDLKVVYHHLKHSCDEVKSATKAIRIISDKSGLSVDRIKEILRQEKQAEENYFNQEKEHGR